jgi:hypothetical protein
MKDLLKDRIASLQLDRERAEGALDQIRAHA